MAGQKHTVDLTTGIGTLSFPHLFKPTKNDKGKDVYDCQILIPKSDKDSIRAILRAIKEVGEAQWGANWKSVRQPMRDGDKEATKIAEDGQTYGDKYPERKGCYFLNARSERPVGVFDRGRSPILDEGEVYSGAKVKVNVTFYPYSTQGNTGIGVGLNGVQKIADGEPIGGGGKPPVESMFEMVDDDDVMDEDYDIEDEVEEEEVEETPPPRKRTAAKKTAAKKTTTRRPAKAVEEIEVDEDDEDDDLFEDDDL